MSTILDLCRKTYREVIDGLPDSELKRSLRAHERVPLFIDNLAKEFTTQKGAKITKEMVEFAVRDTTKLFIYCVKRQASERIMSDVAKLTIKAKQQESEEFKAEVEALETKGADYVLQSEKGEVLGSTVEI